MVGLSPEKYLNRNVDKHLSGGEMKRIQMASVLMVKSKCVILDEPDSGVDSMALKEIMRSIQWLLNDGRAVMLITHQPKIIPKKAVSFEINLKKND